MNPRNTASLGVLALLLLILAWHSVIAPPSAVPVWIATGLHVSPLLPALWLMLRRHPRAPFWGALGALLLFCHGVSEAWSEPRVRALALLESLLAVAVIVAASWDGMRARLGKSRGV